MEIGVAVGLAVLGVVVAELLEALRVYTSAGGWPRRMTIRHYLAASLMRVVLAALVATSLALLGVLCDESLAFMAGLSTLKVVDILFGYSPGD